MNLHTLAEAYACASGLAVTTVAKQASGDARLIANLRAGSSITFRRATKVVQWFSDHWPANEPWPPGVPRPPAQPDDDPRGGSAEPGHARKLPADSDQAPPPKPSASSPGAAAPVHPCALDGRGRIADPRAFCAWLVRRGLHNGGAGLDLGPEEEAMLGSYRQVHRLYADGGERGEAAWPRRRMHGQQSNAFTLVAALCDAGDARYARRAALRARLRGIAGEAASA